MNHTEPDEHWGFQGNQTACDAELRLQSDQKKVLTFAFSTLHWVLWTGCFQSLDMHFHTDNKSHMHMG